ncbi:ATP-binding protein [Geodermatophilus normandii]|uniref:ATP-binding protein n=1 Tax=Geodermatophilus normandii TaxID=1137989 RepID=A0A6P0GL22_9ACTN|nr:ATP-binding protein [Geodermatophilus normandii]NEM07732.1 ATP-binding protein [Geodermatophilus normandii]
MTTGSPTRAHRPAAINVQPHPRLLSVLGDIEFAPWQCIAELVDNAFDEFLRHDGHEETPTVVVSLPGRNSTPRDGEVWVKDNGPGMTLETLNNALRAGWTSNDRYGRLGLFGVGFNIATARLGHVAVVRTARVGDPDWTVVTVDLRAMVAGGHFDLPVTTEAKTSPEEHGTQIVIRQLKPEHHDTLSRQQPKIKQALGDVYSYLLADRGFRLIVDREAVKPRRACVWSPERSVTRNGQKIPAVIHVDHTLSPRHACLDCGLWQDVDDHVCEDCGSGRLEIRERRIWGWVGIQRYLSTSDYGIDFLRNGRKILVRDDSLFRWDDPNEPSGRGEPEYPMEVPAGAGRIVGEIHIDHVRVNYQKNAFEYETPDWKRVVRALRGEGPLLPKRARALGYPENASPLALLVAGYRRNVPGLNYLIPGDGKVALHQRAREWAELFRKGDPEYQSDEQWYLAAQQHDNPTPVPSVPAPAAGDILAAKGLLDPGPNAEQLPMDAPTIARESEDDRRQRWRSRGHRLPDLEGRYGLPGHGAAMQVTAWLVHGEPVTRGDDTERVPVYVAAGKGSSVEVFIDGDHPVFTDFAVDTRDLVVLELAEYLRVRDRSDRALSAVFYDLKNKCLPDHKIAGPFLKEAAERILTHIREALQPVIAGNSSGYWSLVPAEDQAAAEQTFALEGGYANWEDMLAGGEWIDFVPALALVRLVTARPEAFLDGRIFRSAYNSLSDLVARKVSMERLVDLLGDVAILADRPARRGPEELQRGRLSCFLLEQELADPEGKPA